MVTKIEKKIKLKEIIQTTESEKKNKIFKPKRIGNNKV